MIQSCISFYRSNEGNFQIKFVWEARSRVSSTVLVIEETLML